MKGRREGYGMEKKSKNIHRSREGCLPGSVKSLNFQAKALEQALRPAGDDYSKENLRDVVHHALNGALNERLKKSDPVYVQIGDRYHRARSVRTSKINPDKIVMVTADKDPSNISYAESPQGVRFFSREGIQILKADQGSFSIRWYQGPIDDCPLVDLGIAIKVKV